MSAAVYQVTTNYILREMYQKGGKDIEILAGTMLHRHTS